MSLFANAVSSRNVRVAVLVTLMAVGLTVGAISPKSWVAPFNFGSWGSTSSWSTGDAAQPGETLIFPDAPTGGSGSTIYTYNNLGSTAGPYYRPGPIQITSTSVDYQFN